MPSVAKICKDQLDSYNQLSAKMFDVALSSAGAHVALATSSDDKHPPENMIDGNAETFWCSTGMFPQEVVIKFQTLMRITNVNISSYNG